MTILRGRRRGLEVALAGRAFEEALDELQAVLAQQPDFYRGSPAVARLGEDLPSPEQWSRLGSTLTAAGITLEGVCGGAGAERLAAEHALRYEPVAATAETPLREARRLSEAELSPAARSLVADFAGARADIAARRRRGEGSVPRQAGRPAGQPVPQLRAVDDRPAALYHAATLRGGQSLHHTGNVVIVGDVNPGAEIVAFGDIAVFGRLAGVAHAGAGGDASARVLAFDLDPTQLRIASFIGADLGRSQRRPPQAEAAFVRDGAIVVVPLDRLPAASEEVSR
ncbi:MAG TPA: septum site-determining protein MinC [Candidatus Acidoferrum sp.]|nr:septum site-determining protein MinC [Candidatus Acidoferrum sp.]